MMPLILMIINSLMTVSLLLTITMIINRHITDDCVQSQVDIEFNGLTEFYSNNVLYLKFGHLNINRIRHKFLPLAEALSKHVLDILMLKELK